ncbi:Crp/Fnr family transcriptional regulator [Staphylococcus condimenti]|uniref:HTH-type transcriptional regulator ArcR n=1 Tax=Staphylococcus condimenti TaxID=70255 RepID=A0A4V2DWD5_9STAP|nr:Crp/Fnr family transcriptional regulator [Staphylococcus condimenti]RZI01415.1 Crp/Fnr family transcriptional regulator [Staphylococcus condimenti]RZI03765.1 Crp/Fnr family transcriptional regulator [Staphylococcus condimenti]
MSKVTETYQSSIQTLSKILEVPSGLLVPHLSEIYVRNYEKGQVIYYQGSEADSIYLLIEGYISREQLNENGDNYLMLNRDSTLFPINHLFEQKHYEETCTALTDALIVRIPKNLIEYLSKNNEDTFVKIFKLLRSEEQVCMNRNMALMGRNAEQKVINTLRTLCDTIGTDQGAYYEIDKVMTVTLLSSLAGVSREKASHVIKDLSNKNLVLKNYQTWTISKSL